MHTGRKIKGYRMTVWVPAICSTLNTVYIVVGAGTLTPSKSYMNIKKFLQHNGLKVSKLI